MPSPGYLLLWGPYPLTATLMTLPVPLFGDEEKAESTLLVKKAMDGTVDTNIIVQPNRTYKWVFVLARMKALEFLEFYRLYGGKKLRVDWSTLSTTYIGNIKINPLTLDIFKREIINDSVEVVNLEIEFETTQ